MTRFCILILLLINISFLFSEDFCYSRKWLNLLYYEKTGSDYTSLVENNVFFITPQGKTDPKKEYEASLKLVQNQDLQFKSNFPLRYKYIALQNNIKYDPTISISNNVSSVIIAFPSSYMSNPASMFGHLYLVLKTDKGTLDSDILHYVADTDGDRTINYIFKGLSGQYKGSFIKEPYYKEIKKYNYVEARDITYYDLILSEEQIENLQLHYLELKNCFFYYYFLDQNCASFIGKLLNVILDNDIVTKRAYVMPSQIINDLYKSSLLENEAIRIANTRIFNRLFNSLSNKQKRKVIQLFFEKINEHSPDIEVLKTFIIISEYVINNHSNLSDTIRFNRITAYKKLNDLQVFNIRPTDQKSENVNKIQSQSIGFSHLFENNYEFKFNPIYFSEFVQFDKIEHTSVKCLGTKVYVYKNINPLYVLDLMDLTSITQFNSVLNSFSWGIKSTIAYQQSFITNQEFTFGYGLNSINSGIFYGLIGINLTNYDDINESPLANNNLQFSPTGRVGLNQNLAKNLKGRLSYQNKFQKDYITAELIYKQNDFLNKLTILNNNNTTTVKLSVEYLF